MKNSRQQFRWISGAAVGVGLLLAIFYRGNRQLGSFQEMGTKKPSPNPIVAEKRVAQPESQTSSPEKSSFQQALQDCQPAIDGYSAQSPEEWLQFLEKEVGVESKQKLVDNYHLRVSGEGERRLQILYYPEDPAKPTELRYFKLDAEGYPDPLKLPESVRWNPSPSVIESFFTKSEVLRHEAKSQWILKSSKRIQLEIHNHQLFEFHFSNGGKSLACRENICSCIR